MLYKRTKKTQETLTNHHRSAVEVAQ